MMLSLVGQLHSWASRINLQRRAVTPQPSSLNVKLLDELLRAVDPSVMLVPPWLLQNIIAADRNMGHSPFKMPHRKVHLISRERLLKVIADEDISLGAELPPTPMIILMLRPEHEWLSARPAADALRTYWQYLFHSRIDLELQRKLARPCARDVIEKRIERIGRANFNEARFVLLQSKLLLPDSDDRDAYIEFAAMYLGLRNFSPELLPAFFPSLVDETTITRLLSEELDVQGLLNMTRPGGAPDALLPPPPEPPLPIESPDAALRETVDAEQGSQLQARARRAAELGNNVRAAVLRWRVAQASPDDRGAYRAAVREITALVNRLAAPLALDKEMILQWRGVLTAILKHAADAWWSPESRLLYDLQKVCLNHERELYTVNVVSWALELGRRPLRREQPNQRLALQLKALKLAMHRARKARVTPAEQARLADLLHDAIEHVEGELRKALRPVLAECLAAGDVRPSSVAESVSEQKLVDELLDNVTHGGFLSFGNVRDAISRSHLKLHDLSGASEFFVGDQLLRIDTKLSHRVDGIYHHGEIYLRMLQKFSSLFAGNPVGRWITSMIILPFVGAFLIVVALDHTVFLLIRAITGWTWFHFGGFGEVNITPQVFFSWENFPFWMLAFLLLGSINWTAFRLVTIRRLAGMGRALRAIFLDAPSWFFERPWVRAALRSQTFHHLMRYVVKPMIFAVLAWLVVRHLVGPRTQWIVWSATFVATNFLLNSPGGRAVEQMVVHWLRVMGARVTTDIFGNLLRGIAYFFGRALENFDRMIYAVDEWLRFRAGQPRYSLLGKAVLGIFWFYIAYFSRFVLNLLLEPQVNPIKHIPVVTVSAKLMAAMFKPIHDAFMQLSSGRSGRANFLTTTFMLLCPGFFGFLAWELRNNWGLYRANRSKALRPVAVGSHGETLARLLRPGFHSGTVPKIFARYRRAQLNAEPAHRNTTRLGAARLKFLDSTEHVEQAVSRFIEREILALLNQHPAFAQSPISVVEPKIGLCLKTDCKAENPPGATACEKCGEPLPVESNAGVTVFPTRMAIELTCPALSPRPSRHFFEQRARLIYAGIDDPGWIDALDAEQRRVLSAALLGLYKIAGVDLVKEQIYAAFGTPPHAIEISRDQITAWRDADFHSHETGALTDAALNQSTTVGPDRLRLDRFAVTWRDWVEMWNPPAGGDHAGGDHAGGDHAGGDRAGATLGNVAVLPASSMQPELIAST